MKIETKYNIGDLVWWKTESHNGSGIVKKAEIQIGEDDLTISYNVSLTGFNLCLPFKEKDLYPTQEEMIKSLEDNESYKISNTIQWL